MLNIITTGTPLLKGKRKLGFDNGSRVGIFDACAGKPKKDLDKIANTKYNRGYQEGYHNGYASATGANDGLPISNS